LNPILKRAHRVLLITVAALFVTTLLSPIAGLANTDFTVSDQAIVSNPNGTGANLRSDPTLDDSSIIAELPQGATVTIQDTPLPTDTGIWVWVSSDYGNGYVDTSLLAPVETGSEDVPTDVPAEETTGDTTADVGNGALPWAEQIDNGYIVDNNNILPEEGLACRVTATLYGEIISYFPKNETLQVTEARIHDGEQTFVHVNCGDVSGFVNGDFVALESEQVTEPEAPVTEEQDVPEAEAPVEPEATEEEIPVETEVPDAETPVETDTTDTSEDGTPVAPETSEGDENPIDDSTDGEVQEPADDEAQVEDEAPVETDVPVDEMTDATPDATDDATPDATDEAAQDVEPTEEAVETETPVSTDEATGTPDASDEPADTDADDAATPEDVSDVEPSTDADAPEAEEPEAAPQAPATTAPASDLSKMIGSATVTGTNGDGLRCRVAPSDDAATLMMLGEGTKVYVLAEAVNGYLGIDCGGLQGFANVNFLWSGGAGDGEIQKSDMALLVTGTGNGLNCRTGAGTSYPVITVLRDGQSVTSRGKASNGWVAVVCGGQDGFVATTWVAVSGSGSGSSSGSANASTGATSGTATVVNTNGDGLYCRAGAGTSYSAITILSPGQKVSVRGANQGAWVPIVCGGKDGFAHSDFMSVTAGSNSGSGSTNTPSTPSSPATGTVTVANTGGQGLNCRSGAGTSYSPITVLRPGQTVDARSGSKDGWQAVICGGQNGFVSSEFVSTNGGSSKPETPAEKPDTSNPGTETGQTATVVNTNGDGLYCRSGAGSGNSVVTVLSPGQKVAVRGNASNGWIPVTCGGKAGWASADYLSIGGGSAAPSDPKPETPAPSGLAKGDHAEVDSALNLRYEPSLGAGVAAVAPGGTVVLITGGASNGFYPVDWDGLQGYMSGDYLAKTTKDLTKRGGSASPSPSNPPSDGGAGSATGNSMVDYAMRYLGYPYVWATHGPSSFDCSGFTYWVTKNVMGKDIGYGTWTQVSAGTRVSRSDLQPGDLVFFQNTYTAGLSHVGIYIGGDQFIHAENENTGVRISSLSSDYYASRWYGAVRL